MKQGYDKKAEIIIGMLVVQIAAVMFAALVVYFIVENVSLTKDAAISTQDAALKTAKTGFLVSEITGFSIDQNSSDAEGMIMTVSPLPGSDPIKLNNTLIYIQIGNRTARLNFRNGSLEKDMTDGFYTG